MWSHFHNFIDRLLESNVDSLFFEEILEFLFVKDGVLEMGSEQDIGGGILSGTVDPDSNLGKKARHIPQHIQAHKVKPADNDWDWLDNFGIVGLGQIDCILKYDLPQQVRIVHRHTHGQVGTCMIASR